MSQLFKNKAPIEDKETATVNSDPTAGDVYFNSVELDETLKKELAEQGLVGKFLNATQLRNNYGVHHARWRPYKRKGQTGTVDAIFGNDPEGYIRRGDLILGVKTKAEADMHKQYLAKRAAIYSGYNKQKAQELREFAKGHGVKTTISEGYDGEDDGE